MEQGMRREISGQMMKATELEFRHRFWFLASIYGVGFSLYAFDHVNAGQALVERMLGHSLQSSGDRHLLQAIFALGALSALLAALIRTWAAAYLQSDVVHDHKLHSERLVADGPYGYVRNPLYLGGVLLAIGFGLFASRSGFFVVVIGMTAFYYRLIRREEAALIESQGESYRRFQAAVPSLIPSFASRLPSGGRKPRWGQALVGELFMWLLTVSIAVFAVTLSPVLFNVALAAAFVGHGITMAVVRKRRRRQESLTAKHAP